MFSNSLASCSRRILGVLRAMIEEIAKELVDACFKIHKEIGPGLYEKVYEELLCLELNKRGIKFERQKRLKLQWEGITIEKAYIADLIVENEILVELKSSNYSGPLHFKQVLTYLKVADLELGFVVNFNVALFKDGIRRIIYTKDAKSER